MERLDDFRANALENSRAAQGRQEKYYNAKHRNIEYKVGEKLWARYHILSSAAQAIAAKLSPKYAGPFIVTDRIGIHHDEEQFPKNSPVPQDSDSPVPEPLTSPKKDEHAAISQPAPSTKTTAGSAPQIPTSAVPKRRGRPRGSKKKTPLPTETIMLPVKKSATIIEVQAELLQQIKKLVAQMILAQTSEIPPTLGKLRTWPKLLRSLGETTRESAGLLPDRPAPALPAPAEPENEEVAPQSTSPDTPPPSTIDHLTSALEQWTARGAKSRACRRARQQAQQQEKATYEEVLLFTRHPDQGTEGGRATGASDQGKSPREEQKQALKLEQLRKLHKLEEIRTQLHKLEDP
ncbi:hypothetical protein TSAR_000880 [Trichomalopsis sarcophagae]|uniref:Uncharacterized protein n=1 Tax=Trichomalopsis sarcophagae TaxID=543379 RepID=A0A232EGT3_9HYME|nr:hypothetical protein TSAR_000880 [Trichomalopsis sarcophagae]